MKVLIAPDKFKGSLSAFDVARSLRAGFASVWRDAEFVLLPIADGGEGTVEVLREAFGGTWFEAEVHDPIGRVIVGRYCWAEHRGEPVALLEMSEASGMRRVSAQARKPLRSNTRGTGELILAAARRGAKRIFAGLGGSATNDGGIGMAAALGYRFFDGNGRELEPFPDNLSMLARIDRPGTLDLPPIVAAVDVQNPLLGEQGATRTYGPQKGAGSKELEILEYGLARLADVVESQFGVRHRDHPGSGAAGGLGFGLLAFCGAEVRDGFRLVAEALNLEQAIAGCDLVVTGEGRMDAQTLHGKAPAGIAGLARQKNKPVIAFAGCVADEAALENMFQAICPLANGPLTLAESMAQTESLLRSASARAARLMEIQVVRR